MSNRRAAGQRLINLAMKSDFVDLIDENLERCKYADRSQFIRDAMRDKIQATLKITIPHELAMPPGRVGKGGRRPGIYGVHRPQGAELNEANLTPDDVARAGAKRAVAAVEKPGAVYARKRKAASTSGKTS